jgi:hypothetical protein
MNRTFGIVLMSLRKPKIDQGTVAHIPCDKAPIPSYKTCYAILVSGDDLPKILRVKLGTKHRRSDQIDKHDCKLPMSGDGLTMLRDGGHKLFCEPSRKGRTTVGTKSFAGRIFAAASLTG